MDTAIIIFILFHNILQSPCNNPVKIYINIVSVLQVTGLPSRVGRSAGSFFFVRDTNYPKNIKFEDDWTY